MNANRLRVSFIGSVGSSALLLLGVAAGCGGSVSGASSAAVPLKEFASRFAAAWCDNIAACCQAGGESFDPSTCTRNIELGIGASLVEPAIQNPNAVRYDANAAGTCLQGIADLARSCVASGAPGALLSCSQVLTGLLPAGASCTMNEECAPSASGTVHCTGAPYETGDSPTNGVCLFEPTVVLTHGKPGDACVETCGATNPSCVVSNSSSPNALPCFLSDGVYCQTPSLTCQPLGAVGQSCSAGGCVAGAFCDGGTCAAQRDTGPCPAGPDSCTASSFCNSDTSQCEPKRANGSPCQDDSWCQVNQCLVPESNGSASSDSGTCSVDSLANEKGCSGALG